MDNDVTPAAPAAAPVPPQPPAAQLSLPSTPATAPARAGVDPEILRQLQDLQAREASSRVALEAAEKARTEAEAKAAAAMAERNDTLVTSTIATLAAKAHNPAHVVSLLRDRFDVQDGRVVVKGSDKTPEAFLSEWFAGEGKYALSLGVPAGSGTSTTAAAPAQPEVPKLDLTSNVGMTSYVRQRTQEVAAARSGRPPQQPGGAPKA